MVTVRLLDRQDLINELLVLEWIRGSLCLKDTWLRDRCLELVLTVVSQVLLALLRDWDLACVFIINRSLGVLANAPAIWQVEFVV